MEGFRVLRLCFDESNLLLGGRGRGKEEREPALTLSGATAGEPEISQGVGIVQSARG